MYLPRFHPAPPALVLFFLAFLPAWNATALAAPEPGDRARVLLLERGAAPDSVFFAAGVGPGERIVGRFIGADSGAVEIDDEKGFVHVIPHEIVSQFELSGGRKSNAGRGALIGLLAGTVAGLVVGAIVAQDLSGNEEDYKASFQVAATLGGALAGTGLGAIIGGTIKTERWTPASAYAPRSSP